MWSTTKKHSLFGKLSTTKCENVKLYMTTSCCFPCEKGKLLSCRQYIVDNVTSDCFLSYVGLNYLDVDNYNIYVLSSQWIFQKKNTANRKYSSIYSKHSSVSCVKALTGFQSVYNIWSKQ